MENKIFINKIIKPFNKVIKIDGDKSLSIRWALIASQTDGKCTATNLLKSEDVISTLDSLIRLGIKVKIFKKKCEIYGLGLNGFNYKKNLIIDARNSGTLGRLIMGLLIHSKNKIKITGDKSLSKRDFLRVTEPLKKFGADFKTNKGKLPIILNGTQTPKPINYYESKGSAQCKSAVILAALNTKGQTLIKAKKSRNHTEILLKKLGLPIKIFKGKKYDLIKIKGKTKIKPFNYKIPSDISSASFFLVLAALSNNSKLLIKDVNINPSRTGILKVFKLMGIKFIQKNLKNYKGEKIANIEIKSVNDIKPINFPPSLNSTAIDEFLLIFLLASKANGISSFKNLSELNQKESPRLKWGAKILKLIGIKTIATKDSLKIYGNPDFKIKKKIIIKNYLKDHRVFMTGVIAALVFGGEWTIYDKDSIKTSFPSFLKIINRIQK